MFWDQTQALNPLADLTLRWEGYPEEPLPHDGSMLYAIERILLFVAESVGFRTAVTHAKGVFR